jgi:UDP-N-acetylglucosamine/UDP-N-acetylgalactosamine diphosphorylase
LISEQAYPQENVGVFVQRGRGGPLSVVEYSEMDAAMTTEINQSTGRLRYCWSNVCLYPCLPLPPLDHGDSYQYQLHIVFSLQVCLHMFTLDFLNQVANSLEKDSV